MGQRPLVDLLQADAAISPGNSGGALGNLDGEVIGINEAHLPPSTGAVSLGFAIPSATVVDLVEQLRDDGTVEHAFAGLAPVTLTEQIAQRTAAAGDPVRQAEDLVSAVRQHPLGTPWSWTSCTPTVAPTPCSSPWPSARPATESPAGPRTGAGSPTVGCRLLSVPAPARRCGPARR